MAVTTFVPSLSQDGVEPSTQSDVHVIPRLVPRRERKSSSAPSDPAPETPALQPPPSVSSISYSTPKRRILSLADHSLFLASQTRYLIQAWIFTLTESIRGRPNSSITVSSLSPCLRQIDAVLDFLEVALQKSPALDTGSRFGNPAFRDFHDSIVNNSQRIHAELLDLRDDAAIPELSEYLQHAFGSAERLDYGSGHELNFMMWLLCLYQLQRVTPADFSALVLHSFRRYLNLMRKIQSVYYLEPAGSHGVWGLDDYQFLPFLYGASQLVGHPYITPKAIHNEAVLDDEAGEFMYLNQIRWVNSVKTVKGLRWHSPMLDDISSAKNWQKIEDGMKKMFAKEVMGKLPIMQHFLFGSLIPATEEMGQLDPETEKIQAQRMHHVREHGHEPDYWGDCCGIKVPSTIAAGEEVRKRLGMAGGLRPIPFD